MSQFNNLANKILNEQETSPSSMGSSLFVLFNDGGYDGKTVLGIYDSADKAESAKQSYLEDEDNAGEDLEVVKVSLNPSKADWYYLNPDLQDYYKKANTETK